jgi:hypothetical protein
VKCVRVAVADSSEVDEGDDDREGLLVMVSDIETSVVGDAVLDAEGKTEALSVTLGDRESVTDAVELPEVEPVSDRDELRVEERVVVTEGVSVRVLVLSSVSDIESVRVSECVNVVDDVRDGDSV